MNSFNIPQYTPSPEEVKSEVEKVESFAIDRLEVSSVKWDAYDDDQFSGLYDTFKDSGYNVAKCMRAVAEPLLISHFGEAIVDDVFLKYRTIIAERLSKEKTEFINVIVSMTKKG